MTNVNNNDFRTIYAKRCVKCTVNKICLSNEFLLHLQNLLCIKISHIDIKKMMQLPKISLQDFERKI